MAWGFKVMFVHIGMFFGRRVFRWGRWAGFLGLFVGVRVGVGEVGGMGIGEGGRGGGIML